MTADKYKEGIGLLKQAGAGHPPGRTYHAALGTPDQLVVFDVWSSQAAFDKFGKTLMPILQQLGVEPGPPSVMKIHNVIRPPARRAKAKKRAAAKRAKRRAKKR
jgi:hypothetical protein